MDCDKEKLIRVLQAIGYISIKLQRNVFKKMFFSDTMRCVCIDVEYLTWYDTYEVKRLYLLPAIDAISIFKELEEVFGILLQTNGNSFVENVYKIERGEY